MIALTLSFTLPPPTFLIFRYLNMPPRKSKLQKRRSRPLTQSPETAAPKGARDSVNQVPRMLRNSAFPPRLRAIFPITLPLTMIAAGNTANLFMYTVCLNNPFKPFNTPDAWDAACQGAGGAVTGWSSITSGYDITRYVAGLVPNLYGASSSPYATIKTNKVRYRITVQPQSPLDVQQVCVAPIPNLAAFSGTDFSIITNYPSARTKMCVYSASSNANTITGTVDLAMLSGRSHAQWVADNADYVVPIGGSPSQNLYLQIGVQDATGSVLANNLTHLVHLEFDCELYDYIFQNVFN